MLRADQQAVQIHIAIICIRLIIRQEVLFSFEELQKTATMTAYVRTIRLFLTYFEHPTPQAL